MLKADWWSAPLDAAARARGKIAGSSIPLNAAGRLHQSDKMRRGSPGITAKNAGRELSNSITILMQPGSTSIYRHSPAILLLSIVFIQIVSSPFLAKLCNSLGLLYL